MIDDVDDLAELRAAASVTDLHHLLVRYRVHGRSTRHQEAVELFVLHHRDDPVGAVDTAVLLCTESRWNRCTAKLIAGICAAGILDDDALDALSARLLWPDRPSVRHPLSWLGLEWTAVAVATGDIVGRGVDRDRLVDHQRSPAEPPLLRWAAGHLLRRRRTTVDRLRSRAASLDSRQGPAVLAGVTRRGTRADPPRTPDRDRPRPGERARTGPQGGAAGQVMVRSGVTWPIGSTVR